MRSFGGCRRKITFTAHTHIHTHTHTHGDTFSLTLLRFLLPSYTFKMVLSCTGSKMYIFCVTFFNLFIIYSTTRICIISACLFLKILNCDLYRIYYMSSDRVNKRKKLALYGACPCARLFFFVSSCTTCVRGKRLEFLYYEE